MNKTDKSTVMVAMMRKEYVDEPCFRVTELNVQLINVHLHLSVAMLHLLSHVTTALRFQCQLPNPTLQVSYHPRLTCHHSIG